MCPSRRPIRLAGWVLALALASFAFTPRECQAQFFGYGGYGYPGFYGGYGGYGMYGGYGFGYPGMGFGYGYGYPMMGYGMGGFGYPMMGGLGYGGYGGYGGMMGGYGYGYGYPFGAGYPGFSYAGALLSNPYTNPLFGVGLTPLGVNSYFTEMNMLGRGQARAAGVGAAIIRQGR
jgi:hypothetical protein